MKTKKWKSCWSLPNTWTNMWHCRRRQRYRWQKRKYLKIPKVWVGSGLDYEQKFAAIVKIVMLKRNLMLASSPWLSPTTLCPLHHAFSFFSPFHKRCFRSTALVHFTKPVFVFLPDWMSLQSLGALVMGMQQHTCIWLSNVKCTGISLQFTVYSRVQLIRPNPLIQRWLRLLYLAAIECFADLFWISDNDCFDWFLLPFP